MCTYKVSSMETLLSNPKNPTYRESIVVKADFKDNKLLRVVRTFVALPGTRLETRLHRNYFGESLHDVIAQLVFCFHLHVAELLWRGRGEPALPLHLLPLRVHRRHEVVAVAVDAGRVAAEALSSPGRPKIHRDTYQSCVMQASQMWFPHSDPSPMSSYITTL